MKKYILSSLTFVLMFVLTFSYAQAQNETVHPRDDLKEVTAEGMSILGEDTPPAQGRAMARNNARRNALEQAVGVEIHGSTVLYNSDFVSDLVKTATKGLIVKEEVIEDVPRIVGNQLSYYCKLKAYVKPINTEKKGNLAIMRAKVLRPDKKTAMESPVFQDNDEVQVRVSANEDSYINIFSVGQDGSVSKLYPNQHVKVEVLPARQEFIFPDDTYRLIGLRFRVNTPKKLSRSVESVLIIASKEKVDFLSGDIQQPMITDLMKELSEIDPSSWTEKTIGYEVRK
ncbi:MAG: DUF4384 domain-containing protein [Nitrospirae bacterium]|nr:DUF4384 domain-containing protein [Nitrospirota bacterium]